MFRRVTNLARVYRERVFSLALVLVFLLGTLPHTACICADGHREEHCQALACRNLATRQAKMQKCSCCRDKVGGATEPSCCLAKESQVEFGVDLIKAAGSCCNPIVEAPAPMAAAGKVDAASKSLVISVIETSSMFYLADLVRPAVELSYRSTPPPLDVVIVYLHLSI
jgi:hypothetical protein